ncbi:MAG: family 78 glycoside hydrolase catalytic domain [Victivallales bacterium]|nr:family 78 glycoside hydrolase catalytic domain [Victivallales bacterium]
MSSCTAQWIAPKGHSHKRNCHFHASREFELSEIPDDLELQIACESYYLLRVNGIELGRGPARSSLKLYYYDTYLLAPSVHPGVNRVEIEVLCMNVPTGRNVPPEAALWVRCGNLFASDGNWRCQVAEREWKEDAPFYNMQQGLCEWRDLRFADEMTTLPTVVLPATSPIHRRELRPSGIPLPVETRHLPLDIIFPAWTGQIDLTDPRIAVLGDLDEHLPVPEGTAMLLHSLAFGGCHSVSLPQPPENGGFTCIVHFGRLVSGRLEVELTASEGTVVDIAHEETIRPDGHLRSDHTATNPTYNLSDRYILRNGRQTIGNYLVDRGFRMVRLTFRNFTGPVTLHRIEGIDRRYPMSQKGRFFSSDYQLNRLWETAFETISACTTDVFTDCPWRERLFFTNDFVVECRSALQLTGDYTLLHHAFDLIFSEMDERGVFPCVIPSHNAMGVYHGFGKGFGWILSCNLTFPLSVLEYCLYSGDVASLREWYPRIAAMMDTFRSFKTERGVIDVRGDYQGDTTFFDWSFELNGKQIPSAGSALMNSLYIIALQAMEQLRALAGRQDDPSLTPEIEEMRRATIREFYRQDEKTLLDALNPMVDLELLRQLGVPLTHDGDFRTSKITNALALLAGLDSADPSTGTVFMQALQDDHCIPPELFYGSFVQLAWKGRGQFQQALDYIRRYWGPMLDSGTPTLWENGVHSAGKAGFGGSASLCHGFSTSPVDFLQTTLLGIAPLQPGFRTFRFAPVPCGLRFAHGEVPTPHGAIRVAWKVTPEGRFSADLFVPEECQAEAPDGVLSPGNHHLEWVESPDNR